MVKKRLFRAKHCEKHGYYQEKFYKCPFCVKIVCKLCGKIIDDGKVMYDRDIGGWVCENHIKKYNAKGKFVIQSNI